MSDLQKGTLLRDGYGNPIGSLRNAINTHNADVHQNPINHYFYQSLATYTLSVPIAAQDISMTLTSVTGIVAGSRLHLTDSSTQNHDHDLLLVISVVGNVVTVNRPIDKAYAIATTSITRVNIDINTSGTVASPQIYILYPSPGEVWHLTSIDFSMTDATAMDDSTFGGLPQLANGVVIRAHDLVTGNYETFSHWRYNSAFNVDGFQTTYASKAPSGSFGYSGSLDFNQRYEAIVRLANTATESIQMELLVQDNLTGLSTFRIKAHGHIETT